MSEKVYPVPASWKKRAFIDDAAYKKMYADSIKDPAKFWAKHAKRIDWFKAPKKIKNTTYAYPKVSIKWYEDGILKSILTDSRLKSDLVHPNARGYERFAKAIAELMKKEGAL